MTSDEDIEAIRALEAAYDDAWSRGDVDALLACFAQDAVVVNPRGEVAVGIDEIRERIGGFLQGEARDTRHASDLERISFPTREVAVVDGRAWVEGSPAFGRLEHRYTDILVRRGARWVIAHVRAYGLGGGAG